MNYFSTALPKLLNRRWWWITLIVIAGVVVLVRLGFWQLDRLDQKRAYNMRVAERWLQTPYDLGDSGLPTDLDQLEFRRVQVAGDFDYTNQIALTGQVRNGAPGIVLVAPLMLEDGGAVLVARGWLPLDRSEPEFWSEFDEPADEPIIGLIQESQLLPSGQDPIPPDEPQQEWYWINIPAIQRQLPYELLPIFVLQLPEEGRPYDALPFREEPVRLDEGSHFSYAIQWFMFALILGVGYVFFVGHQEERSRRLAAGESSDDITQGIASSDDACESEVDLSTAPPQQGRA